MAIQTVKVTEYSIDLQNNVTEFIKVVGNFYKKTEVFQAKMLDDVSPIVLSCVGEIKHLLEEINKEIKQKMEITERFSTKLTETERKSSKKIGSI